MRIPAGYRKWTLAALGLAVGTVALILGFVLALRGALDEMFVKIVASVVGLCMVAVGAYNAASGVVKAKAGEGEHGAD